MKNTPTPTARVIGNFRWVICALLLFGTTKNYMDRQVIGILKTTLQHEFGWSEIDYGNLVAAFQAAYAIGMLLVGRAIDRLGTRLGYALAMALWSIASMAHGIAVSLDGFLAARFALGFGESAVFPASLKSIAEWFPRKERSLATGIANAGTNVGAIITPLIVPWITVHWGWRWAFVSIGGLGFLWLAAWLWIYRAPDQHPRCSPEELAFIRSDPPEPQSRVPWLSLISYRQTWAFTLGKFLTDPIWWFFLFWTPDFLQRTHGLSLLQLGLPIMLIYLLADAGSIAGGWLSSALIHRGKSVNSARKIAMLICAVSVIPIAFTPRVRSTAAAVLLIGLAVAAHQGFSTNLFTLPSDMFPRQAVASVVGIGGMAGALGGLLIAKVVSYLLQWTGSYAVPFLIAGSAYLVAIAVIQLLAPRLEMAPVAAPEPQAR
ncbi:MAG TPA: MFS transporter [Candidatus Acidoferrales bacterium]|nr:MFS transporter [Candidatus Acidoferrales bacterium]